MIQIFRISGMNCDACRAHVEKAVRALSGIRRAEANLLSGILTVDFDEQVVSADEIIRAVQTAGYQASPEAAGARRTPVDGAAADFRRLLASLPLLAILIYLASGPMWGAPLPPFFSGAAGTLYYALAQLALTLPVVFCGRRLLLRGLRLLFSGAPNMDSLIATGAGAALGYSLWATAAIAMAIHQGGDPLPYRQELYYESAAMILTLISLGRFLENRTRRRTRSAVERLLRLAPPTALIERDGETVTVAAAELRVGDLVVVRPGAVIPVDGTVVSGSSSLDQSAVTGESIPVFKKPGDRVIAASLNLSGAFKFRADAVGSETTLAKIIELVEAAGNSKAPIARLADRISGVFVPLVILIAVLTFIGWRLAGADTGFALSLAISVLVISCPCVLGLATPAAIMAGTGRGAELGILFKSAEALQNLGTVDTVVLDKTGTVTSGAAEITDLIAAPGFGKKELLGIAASLEAPSEHPLADAIRRFAAGHHLQLEEPADFQSLPGLGIAGTLSGSRYYAGNSALMKQKNIDCSSLAGEFSTLAAAGKTPLYFATEHRLCGLIAAMDLPRPSSIEAVREMREMRLQLLLLTGDNRGTAEAVRRQLNIDRAVSEVLPQDKEAVVRGLQNEGRRVAMVGDGINDAPALVRADAGIAVARGADIAVDSADIVLLRAELTGIPAAIRLSRAVMRNIRVNLFWAFFYNTAAIPVAAGLFYHCWGWRLNPMLGAAAMSLSSLCVLTNALRLRFFDPASGRRQEPPRLVRAAMVVRGMTCDHCRKAVEQALKALAGVREVKVDLARDRADIICNASLPDAALKEAVSAAGFRVESIRRFADVEPEE